MTALATFELQLAVRASDAPTTASTSYTLQRTDPPLASGPNPARRAAWRRGSYDSGSARGAALRSFEERREAWSANATDEVRRSIMCSTPASAALQPPSRVAIGDRRP
jgi:hypothetical protein